MILASLYMGISCSLGFMDTITSVSYTHLLASKVLGFTGGDNQGIIGLEVKYEKYLKGMNGKILTMSDAKGVEIENAAEDRIEPIPGNDLHISLDVNIQKYAEQLARCV